MIRLSTRDETRHRIHDMAETARCGFMPGDHGDSKAKPQTERVGSKQMAIPMEFR